jgi:hypothetical protein
MVKLLCFVRRRAGMPPAQFFDHWLREHGALIARTPELRRHVRRYEQNHRLVADYTRERHALERADGGFDGVAAMWFDSEADYRAFVSEPVFRERVHADQERFLERGALAWILAREPDVILAEPGGRARAGARLLCLFARHPSLSREQFHRHWLEHHGGLFQDTPELRRYVLAYEQNHRLESDYPRDLPGQPAYDGVTEQWFESLERFSASLEEPANRLEVEPDVAYMLDAPSIRFILSGPARVVIGD